MQKAFLCFLLMLPLFVSGQTQVGPDRYFPYFVVAVLLAVPVLFWVVGRMMKRQDNSFASFFQKNRLGIELVPNRGYRPELLTLVVRNDSRQDIDVEAPVLVIRKLWSIRKFKLKGINRAEIYPLYLEKSKKHELRISLNVFFQHDPTLRSYYWARVLLKDTKGHRYSTNYITLRKSLFS